MTRQLPPVLSLAVLQFNPGDIVSSSSFDGGACGMYVVASFLVSIQHGFCSGRLCASTGCCVPRHPPRTIPCLTLRYGTDQRTATGASPCGSWFSRPRTPTNAVCFVFLIDNSFGGRTVRTPTAYHKKIEPSGTLNKSSPAGVFFVGPLAIIGVSAIASTSRWFPEHQHKFILSPQPHGPPPPRPCT
jgi:hypothetical protein